MKLYLTYAVLTSNFSNDGKTVSMQSYKAFLKRVSRAILFTMFKALIASESPKDTRPNKAFNSL